MEAAAFRTGCDALIPVPRNHPKKVVLPRHRARRRRAAAALGVVPIVVAVATACEASQAAAPPPLPPHTAASVGQTVTTANGNSVEVVRYAAAFGPQGATRSTVTAAVDVKACASADGDGAQIVPTEFLLLFHDGLLRPVARAGDGTHPALRAGALPAGRCTRGWVFYRRPRHNDSIGVILSASTVVLWKLP